MNFSFSLSFIHGNGVDFPYVQRIVTAKSQSIIRDRRATISANHQSIPTGHLLGSKIGQFWFIYGAPLA